MVKCDTSSIIQRLVRLEESDKYQVKKINEIHKILVGNGQPGLVAEWNQWKGAIKLLGVVYSVAIGIIGAVVGILAYMK
jgi:hypothetical protein